MERLLTKYVYLRTLLLRRDLCLHFRRYLILQIVHNTFRTSFNLITIRSQTSTEFLDQLLHYFALTEYESTSLDQVLALLELSIFS